MKLASYQASLLFALALSPSAMGQTDPSVRLGSMSRLASGLSVSTDARPTSLDETLVRLPHEAPGTPLAWNSTNFPNRVQGNGGGATYGYDVEELFPHRASLGNPARADWEDIELGSLSTGNATLEPPAFYGQGNQSAYFQVSAANAWQAFAFSVRNGANGLNGSNIRRRVTNTSGTQNTGSDIHGYYFPESSGLAAGLNGASVIEQSVEQIGLPVAQDIDGLDWALGVNTASWRTNGSQFFMFRDVIYFTLDPSCIAALNSKTPSASTDSSEYFAVNGSTGVLADAQTVYVISADLQGNWLQPRVHRTAATLGLGPNDVIDALEVSGDSTIFSLQGTGIGPQLRVHNGTYLNAVGSYTLVNEAGVPVDQAAGVNDVTDDVDATCWVDPESITRDTHLAVVVGEDFNPIVPGPVLPDPLGISVTRYDSVAVGTGAASVVLAIDISGFAEMPGADVLDFPYIERTPSLVGLWYSTDYDNPLEESATWVYITYELRNTNRSAHTIEFEVPSNLVGSGARVAFAGLMFKDPLGPNPRFATSMVAQIEL